MNRTGTRCAFVAEAWVCFCLGVSPGVPTCATRTSVFFELKGFPLTERHIVKIASVLLKIKLLNLAADGEGSGNREEIPTLFNPIVVVAEAEMEIRCNVGADFVTDAQGRLIPF